MAEDQDKRRVQQQIDQNLKLVYEEALQAEVPDRFKDLIARLRAQENPR